MRICIKDGLNTLVRLVVITLLPLVFAGCLFPTQPGPGLEHYHDQAPAIGSKAPDFILTNLAGEQVRLSSLIGQKPIVLQLGSHSCPVYRYRRYSMRNLYKKYQDEVTFLLVYTLEAHPVGSISPYSDEEWVSLWNRIPGVLIPQHSTFAERMKRAKHSKNELSKYYQYPYLVDNLDNEVWQVYGAAASPGYIIDLSGTIVLRQAWINPKKLEEKLQTLLSSGHVNAEINH